MPFPHPHSFTLGSSLSLMPLESLDHPKGPLIARILDLQIFCSMSLAIRHRVLGHIFGYCVCKGSHRHSVNGPPYPDAQPFPEMLKIPLHKQHGHVGLLDKMWILSTEYSRNFCHIAPVLSALLCAICLRRLLQILWPSSTLGSPLPSHTIDLTAAVTLLYFLGWLWNVMTLSQIELHMFWYLHLFLSD